jgi:hypothetical protein
MECVGEVPIVSFKRNGRVNLMPIMCMETQVTCKLIVIGMHISPGPLLVGDLKFEI